MLKGTVIVVRLTTGSL